MKVVNVLLMRDWFKDLIREVIGFLRVGSSWSVWWLMVGGWGFEIKFGNGECKSEVVNERKYET